MTTEEFKALALSFQGSYAHPHFDRTAFKVEGKRIFTTLLEESESVNILLPLEDQEIFCRLNKAIYPLPNKWGSQGWTTFDLTKLERAVVLEALTSAYQQVMKRKGK